MKTLTSFILAGAVVVAMSGCGEQPKPQTQQSSNDVSSTKKEKAMWQQFQNSKAQKSLDKEFN